ncbi:hypothetical protein MJO29_008642 [Puccinia striiformis f. sp. tritici]|nr:hypothetical protein MJO29_008642 [Puccinia striiformis f. sp. tritici]
MVAFNFGVIAASLLAIASVAADPNNERLVARELSPEAQTKGRVSDKLDSLGKNLKWLDDAVNQENLNSRVARERMAGYYQLFRDSFQYARECGSLCFQSGSVKPTINPGERLCLRSIQADESAGQGCVTEIRIGSLHRFESLFCLRYFGGSIYRWIHSRRYPILQPPAPKLCRFYGEGGIPPDSRSCYPNAASMNLDLLVFTLNLSILQ